MCFSAQHRHCWSYSCCFSKLASQSHIDLVAVVANQHPYAFRKLKATVAAVVKEEVHFEAPFNAGQENDRWFCWWCGAQVEDKWKGKGRCFMVVPKSICASEFVCSDCFYKFDVENVPIPEEVPKEQGVTFEVPKDQEEPIAEDGGTDPADTTATAPPLKILRVM